MMRRVSAFINFRCCSSASTGVERMMLAVMYDTPLVIGKSDTTAFTLVAKLPTATPTPDPTRPALNELIFTEVKERELKTAGSGEGG
jgi:hypothetical protein